VTATQEHDHRRARDGLDGDQASGRAGQSPDDLAHLHGALDVVAEKTGDQVDSVGRGAQPRQQLGKELVPQVGARA
jgi:hypothetical protein